MTKNKENALESFKGFLDTSIQVKQKIEELPESNMKEKMIDGAVKELIITEWIISALTAVDTESDLKEAIILQWLFKSLNDVTIANRDMTAELINNTVKQHSKLKGVVKTKNYQNIELANEELNLALENESKEDNESKEVIRDKNTEITNNEIKTTLDNTLKEFISNEINSGLMSLHNEMCDKMSDLRTDIENRLDNAVYHLENIINKGFDNINYKL